MWTLNQKKLKEEDKTVNRVLGKVNAEDITATNMLIYVGAVVVTRKIELKTGKRSQKRGLCGNEDWSPRSEA